jgi:thiamine pyrophosphokinase
MHLLPEWLIIANGESLPVEQLRAFAKNKAVLVLDGALTTALAAGIQPQVVIGDFDSLDPLVMKQQEAAIIFVQEADQNTSDLDKGLHYLEKTQPESVTIVNASGGRLDHTLYNLRLLKRFHGKFKALQLITAQEQVFYFENQTISVQADSPQPLAVLAFPQAEVWSSGLVYEMQPLTLELGYQESISNGMAAETAQLNIKGAVLFLCSHATRVFG